MLLYSGSYSVGLFQHQRSPVRVQSSANFLMEHLFTVNCIEMTKIMKKEAGVRIILNKDWKLFCFHFCLLHSFQTLNAPKFWSVKSCCSDDDDDDDDEDDDDDDDDEGRTCYQISIGKVKSNTSSEKYFQLAKLVRRFSVSWQDQGKDANHKHLDMGFSLEPQSWVWL